MFFSIPLGLASAATQLTGQQDELKITATNASVREILESLSSKFNLTYRLPPGVSGELTGQYSGTLNQVLARILDGNDYILEISDSAATILVLGPSGTAPLSTQPALNAIALTPPKLTLGPTPVPAAAKSPPPPLSNYLSANSTDGQGDR